MQVDIFSHEMLLVPIHLREKHHWALCIVDLPNKCVTKFDSLEDPFHECQVLAKISKNVSNL